MNNLTSLVHTLTLLLFAHALYAESVYKCEVNGHPAYQKMPCKNDTGQEINVKPIPNSGLNLSDGFKTFINDWEREQHEMEQRRIQEVRRQEVLNIERQKALAQREMAAAQRSEAAAQRETARAQQETADAIREQSYRRFNYPYRY